MPYSVRITENRLYNFLRYLGVERVWYRVRQAISFLWQIVIAPEADQFNSRVYCNKKAL